MDDVSQTGGIWNIHQRLFANSAYRSTFEERIVLHFSGTGALTPNAALARFDVRLAELGRAVVPETARWGDQLGSATVRYDQEWSAEIEYLRETFFVERSAKVLTQFQALGLSVP